MDRDSRTRFWVVFSRNCVVSLAEFASREDAKAEAMRQAKDNPGIDYFVAAVTGRARVDVAAWTDLRPPSWAYPR